MEAQTQERPISGRAMRAAIVGGHAERLVPEMAHPEPEAPGVYQEFEQRRAAAHDRLEALEKEFAELSEFFARERQDAEETIAGYDGAIEAMKRVGDQRQAGAHQVR